MSSQRVERPSASAAMLTGFGTQAVARPRHVAARPTLSSLCRWRDVVLAERSFHVAPDGAELPEESITVDAAHFEGLCFSRHGPGHPIAGPARGVLPFASEQGEIVP